jgi:hypothetical protein
MHMMRMNKRMATGMTVARIITIVPVVLVCKAVLVSDVEDGDISLGEEDALSPVWDVAVLRAELTGALFC